MAQLPEVWHQVGPELHLPLEEDIPITPISGWCPEPRAVAPNSHALAQPPNRATPWHF